MLKISQEQYDRFQDVIFKKLVWEISEWMIDEFSVPPKVPFEQIRASVDLIATTAWRWGIRDGNLIRLHVYTSKVLGFDYLSHFPEVNKTLQDMALEDEFKLHWFATWVDAVRARASQAKW